MMFIADILGCLDEAVARNDPEFGELAGEAAALIREQVKELDRLRSGDFTKEEIHNFCHKLDKTVSAREFANGCMAYQTQLYGSSPVMDLLRDTDRILNSWGILTDLPTPCADLRTRIREQIL